MCVCVCESLNFSYFLEEIRQARLLGCRGQCCAPQWKSWLPPRGTECVWKRLHFLMLSGCWSITQLTHSNLWLSLSTRHRRHEKNSLPSLFYFLLLYKDRLMFMIFFFQFPGLPNYKSQLLIGWAGWALIRRSTLMSRSMQVSDHFQTLSSALCNYCGCCQNTSNISLQYWLYVFFYNPLMIYMLSERNTRSWKVLCQTCTQTVYKWIMIVSNILPFLASSPLLYCSCLA